MKNRNHTGERRQRRSTTVTLRGILPPARNRNAEGTTDTPRLRGAPHHDTQRTTPRKGILLVLSPIDRRKEGVVVFIQETNAGLDRSPLARSVSYVHTTDRENFLHDLVLIEGIAIALILRAPAPGTDQKRGTTEPTTNQATIDVAPPLRGEVGFKYSLVWFIDGCSFHHCSYSDGSLSP